MILNALAGTEGCMSSTTRKVTLVIGISLHREVVGRSQDDDICVVLFVVLQRYGEPNCISFSNIGSTGSAI